MTYFRRTIASRDSCAGNLLRLGKKTRPHFKCSLLLASKAGTAGLRPLTTEIGNKFRLHFACAQLISALAVGGLMSCAHPIDTATLHPVAAKPDVGDTVNVLIATTRQRSKTDPRDFTSQRNFGLSYQAYTISIPPAHVAGQIEWPRTPPGDPARNFVVRRSMTLDSAGFATTVAENDRGVGAGDVAVFVHGYNTSYEEAAFRIAQLKKDSHFHGAVVGFAWPSRGSLTSYVTDRESSTYSRAYLEEVLTAIARAPGTRRIYLIAHSMGCWLTMEALLQARLKRNVSLLSKLDEVFLMSPDIDVDVFRSQLDTIGRLKHPITVGLSRDDTALGLSQFLADGVPRVGNVDISDKEALHVIDRYGLRVIDMSDATSIDSFNHNKFVDLLPALNRIETGNVARAPGNRLSRTGLFIFNATGIVLQTPLRVGRSLVGQ